MVLPCFERNLWFDVVRLALFVLSNAHSLCVSKANPLVHPTKARWNPICSFSVSIRLPVNLFLVDIYFAPQKNAQNISTCVGFWNLFACVYWTPLQKQWFSKGFHHMFGTTECGCSMQEEEINVLFGLIEFFFWVPSPIQSLWGVLLIDVYSSFVD